MVSEIAWAGEFHLGDLVFHNVDVGSIPSSEKGVATDGDGRDGGMGFCRPMRGSTPGRARTGLLARRGGRGPHTSGPALARCPFCMNLHEIECHITSLPNVTSSESSGYRFFFYATEKILPFATLAESDNAHDNASNLNRDGIFRVNIGVGKDSYKALFPEDDKEWNYAELNRFMPHPQYAAQGFICILNPAGDALARTIQYIEEAHAAAKDRFERKRKRGD